MRFVIRCHVSDTFAGDFNLAVWWVLLKYPNLSHHYYF